MPRKKTTPEKPGNVDIIHIHPKPTTETNDVELALVELEQLKDSPAWLRIVKFYKEKMEVLEKQMWKEGKKLKKHEIESLIDRRNMCTQFMNLPEILMGGIKMKDEMGKEIELDPFEKPKTFEQVAKDLLG